MGLARMVTPRHWREGSAALDVDKKGSWRLAFSAPGREDSSPVGRQRCSCPVPCESSSWITRERSASDPASGAVARQDDRGFVGAGGVAGAHARPGRGTRRASVRRSLGIRGCRHQSRTGESVAATPSALQYVADAGHLVVAKRAQAFALEVVRGDRRRRVGTGHHQQELRGECNRLLVGVGVACEGARSEARGHEDKGQHALHRHNGPTRSAGRSAQPEVPDWATARNTEYGMPPRTISWQS